MGRTSPSFVDLIRYGARYLMGPLSLVFGMHAEGNLPLNAIPSLAPFVIFSLSRGLISEHRDHAQASRGLAVALSRDQDDAIIYRREADWIVH